MAAEKGKGVGGGSSWVKRAVWVEFGGNGGSGLAGFEALGLIDDMLPAAQTNRPNFYKA
jgi:hypothetical protein